MLGPDPSARGLARGTCADLRPGLYMNDTVPAAQLDDWQLHVKCCALLIFNRPEVVRELDQLVRMSMALELVVTSGHRAQRGYNIVLIINS